MSDGIFPSLVSRTRDANTASNVIYVQPADGSGNTVNVVSNALSVTFTNTSLAVTVGYQFVDDTAFTPETDKVAAIGFFADEAATDSVTEGDIGIARMTLDRKILVRIVGGTDTNRWDVNSSGQGLVYVSSHGLTTSNPFPISATTAANSISNPIYVSLVTSGISATEIHDYDTSVNVAVDTADNHDYTVTGTTFLLRSIIVSGSGNIKAELQVGPLASLVSKAVLFLTGRQGDTKQLFFDPAIEVPVASTGTVRIVRTNRQGATMDVYSTIIGNDLP